MGGKKSLISSLVINSGLDPPVSSNKARRRTPSARDKSVKFFQVTKQVALQIPNLSATPGRYQTGSTATLVTCNSPNSLRHIFPSASNLPALTLLSSSGSLI